MISIILSTNNELRNGYLDNVLKSISNQDVQKDLFQFLIKFLKP